jgi:hypothetical protein
MEASIEHYRSPEAVLAAARAQQVRVYIYQGYDCEVQPDAQGRRIRLTDPPQGLLNYYDDHLDALEEILNETVRKMNEDRVRFSDTSDEVKRLRSIGDIYKSPKSRPEQAAQPSSLKTQPWLASWRGIG